MTALLEETTVEDVDLSGGLLCGEKDCKESASHRAFYACCLEGTLLCRMHRRNVQRWINMHSKDECSCSIHGTKGTVKELLKIVAL